jgi:hypothetical protein
MIFDVGNNAEFSAAYLEGEYPDSTERRPTSEGF